MLSSLHPHSVSFTGLGSSYPSGSVCFGGGDRKGEGEKERVQDRVREREAFSQAYLFGLRSHAAGITLHLAL